jgi:hypothetical protein
VYGYPGRGDFVEVVDGRYEGRRGVVIAVELAGGGRGRLYPVVLLHARGRAAARRHRFVDSSLRVIPRDEEEPQAVTRDGGQS